MRLRTKTPSALNNPSRWNQRLKQWFDVESYQQRINDRAGLNKDGRPVVRLVWGQDVIQRAYFEDTPRYWTKRQKVGPAEFIWFTVPRWIFERRLEPEQYVEAWNAKRYSLRDPTQGHTRCGDCGNSSEPAVINGKLHCRGCTGTNITGGAVIDKGPPPDEYYVYMMDCAVHEQITGGVDGWPLCCTRAFYTDRMRCWGEYRQPSDLDLEIISQSTRAMEADKFRDPYRALTVAEMEETELASNMQVERAELAMEAYEEQMMAEFNRLHGWRVTGKGRPIMVDMGRKSEGGIILPD